MCRRDVAVRMCLGLRIYWNQQSGKREQKEALVMMLQEKNDISPTLHFLLT